MDCLFLPNIIIWLKTASSICSIKVNHELIDLINTYILLLDRKNDLEVPFH